MLLSLFSYLRSTIREDNCCEGEIERRIELEKRAFHTKNNVLNNKDISIEERKNIYPKCNSVWMFVKKLNCLKRRQLLSVDLNKGSKDKVDPTQVKFDRKWKYKIYQGSRAMTRRICDFEYWR